MHLKWLEAFVAVARIGKVSQAANQLHQSQSTLSRQLLALEQELNTELFVRQVRGVTLTDTGRIVLRRATQILDEFRDLHQMVEAEHRSSAVARIGLPPGLPRPWIRTYLTGVTGLEIIAEDWTTNEQLEHLRTGHLDIAFTRDRSSNYPSRLVLVQQLGVAVPPHSSLLKHLSTQGTIHIAALEGLRIMAHAQSAVRSSEASLLSMSSNAGIKVDWVFRRFGYHGGLVGELARVEGAMTTDSSQLVTTSGWSWFPLEGNTTIAEDLTIRTWINWRPDVAPAIISFINSFPKADEN